MTSPSTRTITLGEGEWTDLMLALIAYAHEKATAGQYDRLTEINALWDRLNALPLDEENS